MVGGQLKPLIPASNPLYYDLASSVEQNKCGPDANRWPLCFAEGLVTPPGSG